MAICVFYLLIVVFIFYIVLFIAICLLLFACVYTHVEHNFTFTCA